MTAYHSHMSRSYFRCWNLFRPSKCSRTPILSELYTGKPHGDPALFSQYDNFSSSHYVFPSHPVRQGRYVVDPISQRILIGGVQEKSFLGCCPHPMEYSFPGGEGKETDLPEKNASAESHGVHGEECSCILAS